MNDKSTKRKILLIVMSLIILIITLVSCIKLYPLLASLRDETNRLNFENYINSLGIRGVLLLLLIQVLQIFIAIIPGEIVELVTGLLYGTWGGLAICLIGNIIASFLIYLTVKLFAKSSIKKYQDKLKQYNFLNNRKKISLYLFIIYLIPGLPKDIITYLVPFLPIKFIHFIIVTSIARIPSIISSTYSSHSFLNNNPIISFILIGIFAFLAVIGFIFKDKIISYLKNGSTKNKENGNNASK